jgi:hypothetical protein
MTRDAIERMRQYIKARKKILNEWLCKKFGHSEDPVDVLVFKIMCDALNREQLNPRVTCKRCGLTTSVKFMDGKPIVSYEASSGL